MIRLRKSAGFSSFISRFIVPVIIVLLECYAVWGYSYEFCYLQLYQRFDQKSVCIGLIVISVVLILLLWFVWFQVLIVGPGKQPTIPPFRILPENSLSEPENEGPMRSIIPPDIYPCDEQGYPIWCSNCQSLKMARTHHSNKLGYCIPRFDHYCIWIGTVIGRKNYKLFIQLTLSYLLISFIVLISVAVYIPKMKSTVNGNVYAIFGLACCAVLMCGPLLLTHIYYMGLNKTSIEIIEIKNKVRASRKFFCIYNPGDGYRYVVQFLPGDNQDFWNKKNVCVNIKEYMGNNIFTWFIPWSSNFKDEPKKNSEDYFELMGQYHETMSNEFIDVIFYKIQNNEYVKRLLVNGDELKPTKNNQIS